MALATIVAYTNLESLPLEIIYTQKHAIFICVQEVKKLFK